MSQYIFITLWGLIGNVGKNTERRNIYKGVPIKFADITGKFPAPCGDPGCFHHILGKSQTHSEIIRTACRNIPDGNLSFASHQTGHDFVQRAVTTAAYDQIIAVSFFSRGSHCIAGLLRRINGHFIPVPGKHFYDIEQLIPYLSFSCIRIKDK